MSLALSGWWIFGWSLAAIVILIAAALLIVNIVLARRIASQAAEIERALDGARAGTDPLWKLPATNLLIDQSVRGLAAVRLKAER